MTSRRRFLTALAAIPVVVYLSPPKPPIPPKTSSGPDDEGWIPKNGHATFAVKAFMGCVSAYQFEGFVDVAWDDLQKGRDFLCDTMKQKRDHLHGSGLHLVIDKFELPQAKTLSSGDIRIEYRESGYISRKPFEIKHV